MFFDSLIHARDVLLDVVLRQIYDSDGEQGLKEYALAQDRAELDETSFDDESDEGVQWREVQEGEVFGAGEYFKMDQSTGVTYVAVNTFNDPSEQGSKDDVREEECENEYAHMILYTAFHNRHRTNCGSRIIFRL